MKWGTRCIGVGVMSVLELKLRSGIVGEIVEQRGNSQSMFGIIVFLGMRWDINGLLVGKERKTRAIMATTVPQKGGR
eukprot:10187980-Karenia_brevis.AAC.1